MNKRNLILLVSFAFIFILVGIVFIIMNLGLNGLRAIDSELISVFFSLAGIILFFAALMYQIQEYKLQLKELEKSVEAQIRSSEVLDEQKMILIRQNVNSMIFSMVESFNLYRARNLSLAMVDELTDFYKDIFALRWNNNLDLKLNKGELNQQFAIDIKEIFSSTIIKHQKYYELKRYIQFLYNILFLIDSNTNKDQSNYLTPFLYNQLNTNELIILNLSNLVEVGMPLYSNMQWSIHNTKEIVDLIRSYSGFKIDFEDIDQMELTKTFIKLKQ